MIVTWVRRLVTRHGGRLLAAAAGVAVAVALLASLGTFLTASKSSMTQRAAASVAVDWQVAVQQGGDPAAVLATTQSAAGVTAALPVSFGVTSGLRATAGGTTQTTGPGVVMGIPPGYAATFPGEIRRLTGASHGVMLAQQTAANLHVGPGDQIVVTRAGLPPVRLRVGGIVDLPQADSLFQNVGAPPQSQPSAPPDNVVLVPQSVFDRKYAAVVRTRPDLVTAQVHAARSHALPADPSTSYKSVTSAANNLEAQFAGAGLVGDNLGAALDAAREDALYAQILFLFLGLPGAVLAAVLTAAIAGAGAARRRREQATLRARGATMRQVVWFAAAEALVVGVAGSLAGLVVASGVGKVMFGSTTFGASTVSTIGWTAGAMLVGLAIAAVTILTPAVSDFKHLTVIGARQSTRRTRSPWWMRYGVDLMLIASSALVFWATSRGGYSLVLAPEGVAAISVNYWAFLGPGLLWVGAGLLCWRLAYLALGHGRRPLALGIAPFAGTMSDTVAAGISRQRRVVARSIVLLALALAFAASTATFNATYHQQSAVDARLTNGADVTVTESPGVSVGPDAASTIAAVAGVRQVEPIQHRFAYVGSDLQDLYGVNPETISAATSLQDAYFQGGTADELMAKLAAQPDAVLVSDETVVDFQLQPGDVLNLRLQDSRTKKFTTVPFHYAGIVREFPTAPHDSFFVANESYVASTTGNYSVGAFLVDTGGQDTTAVAADIQRTLGPSATVTDLATTRSTIGSSLTAVDLTGLTRVELSFALVLAAAAGGLVLALGLAERRRTFAIATTLGATRRQLRGLALSEALVITVGGVLGGIILGWVLSQMLVKVLTGVFDPPPDHLAVPWLYLLLTVVVAVLAIVGAAVISSRGTGRPAVEELRQL